MFDLAIYYLPVFHQLLKKAEELTGREGLHYCKRLVQRAAVYQSLANYYKKQKKLQAALQVASKAVQINQKLSEKDRLPIAYFLAACLHGLLGDPSNAGLMYTECLAAVQSQQSLMEMNSGGAVDTVHVLRAATLHNMAIEWANLQMPDQCRETLAGAMEVGVNHLPQAHPVVLRVLETYKIMRQNFLFLDASIPRRNDSDRHGAVTRLSPKPPMQVLETNPSRPSPPPANTSPSTSGIERRSPRVQNLQKQLESTDSRVSPVRPATRPNEHLSVSNGESPRRRVQKRPLSTPEVPSGLYGRPFSPGAIRTSLVPAVPEETYAHALNSKHRESKANVLAEARAFVARRKAATKIQVRRGS
jgi:hypothetical protein